MRLKWNRGSLEFISRIHTHTFSSYRRFISFSIEPNRLSSDQFLLFIIWTTINFSRTINSLRVTRNKSFRFSQLTRSFVSHICLILYYYLPYLIRKNLIHLVIYSYVIIYATQIASNQLMMGIKWNNQSGVKK